MSIRNAIVMTSLAASLLLACGDDDTSPSPDAGTSSGGKGGSSGRGGSGGRSGAAGAAGKAGTGGSAGKANAGGSGGKGGSSAAAGSGGKSGSESEPITIRFKAKFGSQDFACGHTVTGIGSANSSVAPADFRAFVQGVSLIDADDKDVPVKFDVRAPWQSEEVALLDFEDGTGACAGEGNPETNYTITGSVPKGTYKGIRFVNGVPDDLNHGDPATFNDPLKTYSNLTWGWLFGFRFIKLELTTTTDADAGMAGGLLHVGSTACSSRSAADGGTPNADIECLNPNRNRVTLMNYKVGESVIVADVAKVFEHSDLSVAADCHSAGDACPDMFSSFGVKFSDGTALDTQTAYHLE